MKQPSVAKNYLFNLTYQVLIVALPLVVTPYISRVLGADGLGAYSYAQSVVSCFALAGALGTAVYGQRRVAQLRHDPPACARAFWEIFCLRVCTVGLALALYLGAVLPFGTNRVVWALAAVEILAAVFDISWYFQGLEDFAHVTACNTALRLLCALGIFVLVRQKSDLPLYILLYTGSVLVSNLSLWCYLPRRLARPTPGHLDLGQHLRPTWGLFVPQVAIYVYTVLDKTMIGFITGSDFENGYYDQAQKLQRVLLALITALGTVLIPRVAALWTQGRRARIGALLDRSFRVVLAAAFPLIVGIWLVAGRFVPLFFGPGYAPVAPLMRAFSLILLLAGLSGVTGNQYMIPTGKEKLYTRTVTLGAVVNVLLNSLLIPAHGALGAAAASVAAEAVITAAQLWALHEELDYTGLWGMAPRYLADALAMGAAVALTGHFAGEGPLALVAMVAVGGLVYGGLLLVQRDPLLQKETWQEMTSKENKENG